MTSFGTPGEAVLLSDNQETALVPHGEQQDGGGAESSGYSSSDSEEEPDLPPGPVDNEKSSVGGPGTTGGHSNTPTSFFIIAKDSRSKRLTEGGHYVVVKVIPGNTARAAGAREAEAIVKDNNDGSYTATYSVEARGDYELCVEINGSPIGGSPFPVFFSPPEERSAEADGLAAANANAAGLNLDISAITAASTLPMPIISILGKGAYEAHVKFPEDDDTLTRTLIVGNMNPQVTLEQLKQLFGFSGSVKDCTWADDAGQFAFVEYNTPGEAESALGMDKLNVIDRQIRVESAKTAFESKGQSGGTQFAALQLQQIQQLQMAQMQQHSLATQVAQMRVQAKANPGSIVPGLPQNSASQKAAAFSAIAALSKRLQGGGSGAPSKPAPISQAGKRRREVSPTLRYRSKPRSMSPIRRRPNPPRPRSRDRRSPARRPSRDHHHRRHRRDSRERRSSRRRDDSSERRDSRHRRARSRSEEGRLHQGSREDRPERSVRSGSKDYGRGPSKPLHTGEQRDGSGRDAIPPENGTASGRNHDGKQTAHHEDGKSRRDRSDDRYRRERSERKQERSEPHGDRNMQAEQDPDVDRDRAPADLSLEAQELRERALAALKAMPSAGNKSPDDAAGDQVEKPRSPATHLGGSGGREASRSPDADRRRSKRHKKEKKEKRHKRDKRGKEDRDDALELPDIEPDL